MFLLSIRNSGGQGWILSSMSEFYTSSRSQRSMLQSGSSWQSSTLLATEVSEVLKVINERYRPYVRFWLQIGFSIPVSKSFGTVLEVRSDIPFWDSDRWCSRGGSIWQDLTLLAAEVSEVLKVINERYRLYVRFWLRILIRNSMVSRIARGVDFW